MGLPIPYIIPACLVWRDFPDVIDNQGFDVLLLRFEFQAEFFANRRLCS